MDANKKRQVLTETDLLSIVESTEAEMAEASKLLQQVAADTLDGTFDASTLEKLVKEKFYQASTIQVEGKPAFVLVHGQNPLGWLIIEGVAKLGKAPIRHLLEGAYAIARQLNAPKILFVTRLTALYKYTKAHNFKDLGAVVISDVPPNEKV